MRHRTFFALLLLLSAFLFACTHNPSTSTTTTVDVPESSVEETSPEIAEGEMPIAWIDGTPVDHETFDEALSAVMNQYGQTYAQFGIDISGLRVGADGRVFELAIEAEAFLQIVQQVLTRQEADRRGITISDEQIDAEVERQYQAYLDAQGWTEADLAAVLAGQGRTLDEFKKQARTYIADQFLAMAVQRAVAGPLEVTEEQLTAYFEANRATYGGAELADVIDDVRTAFETELSYDAAVEWYEGAFRAATLEFSDPLLEAAVYQTENLDSAIAVLVAARANGTSNDPYLPYVLGSLYEKKIDQLRVEQASSTSADDTAEFDAQIGMYRTRALECYQDAQTALPDDTAIQDKVSEFSGAVDADSL